MDDPRVPPDSKTISASFKISVALDVMYALFSFYFLIRSRASFLASVSWIVAFRYSVVVVSLDLLVWVVIDSTVAFKILILSVAY